MITRRKKKDVLCLIEEKNEFTEFVDYYYVSPVILVN